MFSLLPRILLLLLPPAALNNELTKGNDKEERRPQERFPRSIAMDEIVGGLNVLQTTIDQSYEASSNRAHFGNLKMSLDLVRRDVQAIPDADRLLSVLTAVDTLTTNLATFTNPHAAPTDLAAGILRVIGGFHLLSPSPDAPIVSTILSIVAGLLGIFSPLATPIDTETMVDEMISKRLDEQHKNAMIDEIAGAKRILSASHEYLEAYRVENLTRDDIYILSSTVPIYSGVALFGKLSSYINRLWAEAAATEGNLDVRMSKATNAFQLAELYTELTGLRQLLLINLHAVLSRYPGFNAAAKGAEALLDHARREDLNAIKFIRLPNRNQASTAAIFYRDQYLEDYPGMMAFTKGNNAFGQLENLKQGCWTVQNARFTSLFLTGSGHNMAVTPNDISKWRFADMTRGIRMAPVYALKPNGKNWCYRWVGDYYEQLTPCENKDGVAHQVVQTSTPLKANMEVYIVSTGLSTPLHLKVADNRLTASSFDEEDSDGGSFWHLKQVDC